VRGKIMGNVGLIKIEGRVDKDVEVTIDQELEFIGEGFIRGNLNYSAWKPLGIPKERIGGELIYSKIVTKENSQKHMRDKAQGTIFTIFAFLILGAVIIKLTPKYHENVINSCRKYFWKNLLAGIIWLILAPAIGVLLCITIIGIPLAIVVFALYAIIIVVAYSLSALWIGTGIYKPKRLTPWTKFGQLLLGLAIISLIWWIPMAGWLIVFVLLTSSIGAMINVVRGGKMVKKTRKRKTHG
ncbi:MAG: hypothetical protein KAR20_24545, partial [Candidatus Heimdallarchaeota archaeon]|nr:hypothetical protein [Candidatus Heimdallarchaeota archaeon]